MKIKVLRTTNASGKRVNAGKKYDLSDKDAKLLIAIGKAEAVVEEVKEVKAEK